MHPNYDPGAHRPEEIAQTTINMLVATVHARLGNDTYTRLNGTFDTVPTQFVLKRFPENATNVHGATAIITTLPRDNVSVLGRDETAYEFIPVPDSDDLQLRRRLPFDYNAASQKLRESGIFDRYEGTDEQALQNAVEERHKEARRQETEWGLDIVDEITGQALLNGLLAATEDRAFLRAMALTRRTVIVPLKESAPRPFWRRGWLGRILRGWFD